MNIFPKTLSFFITAFLLLLAPSATNAYLDPGTGSFVIQAAIALLAGAGFTAKMYWGKIKSIVRPTHIPPAKDNRDGREEKE